MEEFISLSVDNTSVNMGIRNSLCLRVLIKHPQIYVCACGCACHIIHNTSSKAAAAFLQITGFDADYLAINVAYWFDKAQRGKLACKNFVPFVTQHIKKLYLMFLHNG